MVAHPNMKGHDNPIHPALDTFRLIAETRKQAIAVADTARDAIKAFYRNPFDLALFIERHHTPVYVFNNALAANIALRLLGFEPGFVPPSDSRQYKLLQRMLDSAGRYHLIEGDNKPNCHFANGVFVLTRPLFTVGFISHQLHHWLAFRSGMSGYCQRSQRLYKKFWNEHDGIVGAEVYDMTAEDIMALKSAINRDLEALMFLREIASEILVPAKQGKRFNNDGRTSA